jgi:hypothetical protein
VRFGIFASLIMIVVGFVDFTRVCKLEQILNLSREILYVFWAIDSQPIILVQTRIG